MTHVHRAESARDGLLPTKLFVPLPRPGFVRRSRLQDQLEAQLDRGLTLVSAPAGFGKTSLLAEWARTTGRPVAWISVS